MIVETRGTTEREQSNETKLTLNLIIFGTAAVRPLLLHFVSSMKPPQVASYLQGIFLFVFVFLMSNLT